MRISDWSSDVCSSDLSLIFARRSGPSHVRKPETFTPASLGLVTPDTKRRIAADCGKCFASLSISSEERRVGKSVSVRVDLGGRRMIKKKKVVKSRGIIRSRTQNTENKIGIIEKTYIN